MPMTTDQAKALRGLMERRQSADADPPELPPRTALTVAVTSGKGGVGKSNIALNLAIALAKANHSVCLLDANLGLGNLDLLCGLNGYWNLSHVLSGARTLQEVVLKGPCGIELIPGASGLCELADCHDVAQRDFLAQLEEMETRHEFLILDTGTGIHTVVRQFVASADVVLNISTPEPTSVANAYAALKALAAADIPRLEVIVNQAASAEQARLIFERIEQTCRIFLQSKIGNWGVIPHDEAVPHAVAWRKPFLLESPHAPASRAVREIASRIAAFAEQHRSQRRFFDRFRERISRSGSL